MLSDDRIIRHVLAGRTDEFRELIVRHQAMVFRVCRRILHRHEDAEDAAQETFVKAFGSLSNYAERGRFPQWLRTIAINTSLKRLPRELPTELTDLADTVTSSTEVEVLRRMDCQEVWRAIDDLPATYRTALVLRYGEELSYKEIGEALGESVNVIQVRLHRAKKALANALAGVMTSEV